MPALIEPPELTRLRSQRPDIAKVEWNLAVAPYGLACFKAKVNDPGSTLGRGSMTIPYSPDTYEANVRAGMTLWIGSDTTKYDLGRVRIRGINTTLNTLSVAENDEIAWAHNQHLSCPGAYGFYEIWGRYPRLTESAGTVTFYKDYDIKFNDLGPDVALPPKANGGPPVCAFLNDEGWVDVSFVGDRSYTVNVGLATLTYVWDFADGFPPASAQAGTCAAPIIVRFSSAGFRYVSLSVTDAHGRSALTRIPVWIFSQAQPPYTKVEVLSQDARPSWRTRLRVFQTNTSAEDILYRFPDGALVVLFTRTEYGGVVQNIGGFCHRENVRFVGWIERETLTFDHETGAVEFDAIVADSVLERIPGFGLTLEDTTSPTDWYEMKNLNVDRALHHLLEYHTTANQVCHIERVGEGQARPIKIQTFPDSSIYEQAQEYLLKDAHCRLTADRQGILRATRDPQFLSTTDRNSVAVVCDLIQSDWLNDLAEEHPHVPQVGLVRLGGFAYETPFLAQAPGDAPLQQEEELRSERHILKDEAESLLWAGLALTKANNPYPHIPLELTGYWPVFDPAFQEYVRLTTADPLGRNPLNNKRFVVREVVFDDQPDLGTSITRLGLEMENAVLLGESVPIPEEPPPEPPFYPSPPLDPPVVPAPGPVGACIAWTYDQLGYTDDLLLHHVSSVATTGTTGTALYDTARNFENIGVAIGDRVENLAAGVNQYKHTSVAAIVSANQLTLTADIGLDDGSAYHICGAQWVNICPDLVAGEYIIQFKWVRTGKNAVAGWLLTTGLLYPTAPVGRLFYAPNVLTPSPSWSVELTESDVVAMQPPDTNEARFRGLAGLASNPQLLVISLHGCKDLQSLGAVYTANTGSSWTLSVFPNDIGSKEVPYFCLGSSEIGGQIFTVRRRKEAPAWLWRTLVSTNGGASFSWTAGKMGSLTWFYADRRFDLFNPYGSGSIHAVLGDTAFALPSTDPAAPMRSDDLGASWSSELPAGYTRAGSKRGIVGWLGSPNDILTVLQQDPLVADHHILLHSKDGGTSWLPIGDSYALFPWIPTLWAGNTALVSDAWMNQQNVIIWVGLCISSPPHGQCRIRYTDDDGTTWYNKTGNWYTVFTTWNGANGSSGQFGNVGCLAMPRVGANSYHPE